MKRILMILLLMGAATAVAQSGTYDVTCEGVVVGEATVVDGSVGVVWEPDVQCETPYAIEELDATLHFNGDGSISLVPNEGEEPVDEEPIDEEPVAKEEPVDGDDEKAEEDGAHGASGLTGLDRADEVAGENGAHGRERARAAQERGKEAAEEIVDDVDDVADEKIKIEGSAAGKVGVGLGRR